MEQAPREGFTMVADVVSGAPRRAQEPAKPPTPRQLQEERQRATETILEGFRLFRLDYGVTPQLVLVHPKRFAVLQDWQPPDGARLGQRSTCPPYGAMLGLDTPENRRWEQDIEKPSS